MLKMFRILLVVFLSIYSVQSISQNNEAILDDYIREGLTGNLVVQQKNVSLENALYALKEAKRLYIPSFDFQALYTTAQGGRSYEIPIGDYINPVFNTINQFLGQNFLPEFENEKINFLPKNYYDAKFRLSVPIVNMDIIHNNHIHQKQLQIQENELEIFERELVKEIKVAYYNYLSAMRAASIHQHSINLAEESKRTNEKLVEAGSGLTAYVMRSEAEIEQYKASKKAAELQANSVKKYFNALLNRDAEAEILYNEDLNEAQKPILKPIDATAQNREELASLDQVIAIREDLVKMKKQVYMPKLGGFVDLGSQAEEMRFNKEALYYMVGLQLEIPIFAGFRNNLKIKQAQNEVDIAKLRRKEIEQKLEVAVSVAHNKVLTEQSNYEAANKQLEMAETYFRLIDKGYNSGVNSYIETIDARTQLSMARLAANISYYQLLAAFAELERETASYSLPSLN